MKQLTNSAMRLIHRRSDLVLRQSVKGVRRTLGFRLTAALRGAASPAKCEGFAETRGGGHRPIGDCANCGRFSWDCGHPGDGDAWIERPASPVGCPLKLAA